MCYKRLGSSNVWPQHRHRSLLQVDVQVAVARWLYCSLDWSIAWLCALAVCNTALGRYSIGSEPQCIEGAKAADFSHGNVVVSSQCMCSTAESHMSRHWVPPTRNDRVPSTMLFTL